MNQPDWKAIEAQAEVDLENIQAYASAYAFLQRYFSRDLQGRYRSHRFEMGHTPRETIDMILSLPPLE